MEIEVIDSHTGGEPTRAVVSGWPEIKGSSMKEKLEYVKQNHEHIRKAVVCEPRGHDAIVGALLTPPVNKESLTGVIFFNDVGYLGMCGHAAIGLVETLRHLGKFSFGEAFIDTPAGTVKITVDEQGVISVINVTPRLLRKDLQVTVPGLGTVVGDVAYGGNWFFLVSSFSPDISLKNLDDLIKNAKGIRSALESAGVRGDDGHLIDHIEFFAQPTLKNADSKNFVLCPGNAYDRSPCGTGTSAKMICLYERSLLQIGESWIQESVCASTFECRLEIIDGEVAPIISSEAFLTSRSTLFFNEEDPFCWGIT